MATVGFGLESANVVGYSSVCTTNGCKALGASFAPVTSTMNLQDLKVTGYNHEEGFDGELNVQFLDGIGKTTDMYYWIDIPADEEDPESVAFYGWYDGSDTLVENVTINPGDGLWVFSSSKDFGLQSAGQVIKTSTAVTLNNGGMSMVANPIPMDIDLQDIFVGGYNHEDGFEGEINVQFLDVIGKTDAMYYWIDIPADPEDPESVAFYGWYDGEDTLVENVTVGAGTALWTYSDSNAYSLIFPGVSL